MVWSRLVLVVIWKIHELSCLDYDEVCHRGKLLCNQGWTCEKIFGMVWQNESIWSALAQM